MPAIRHQIDVMHHFIFGEVGLVTYLDTTQVLHPGDTLHAWYHQAQRVAVFRAQHLAIHGPCNHDIVKCPVHRNRPGHR